MAVRQDAANNHGPVFLRSYKNPQEMSMLPDIKLWQAARATSAAPAYFAPLTVGEVKETQVTLVDGGLQANNPLGW
jgi:patatin-like phospholipase/acyl hydrolase